MGVFSPSKATEADERIEAAFHQSYVYRVYLKDDSLKIEARNGVVTLSGTVAEEFHKSMAEDTAEGIVGVTGVDNQLTTAAEDAAEYSDLWISRKVRMSLLLHRNVSAAGTTVEVKDGVVTLTGEASSEAQRELTAEYAGDVEKVVEVRNHMTVTPAAVAPERTDGERLDDASISTQVKTALFIHRSTNSLKTKVQTLDGVVTLTGIAKNAAEKSLVTKLATDIRGVTSVKNEMTVDSTPTK
jgi:osmotically-inducible protein OsmY